MTSKAISKQASIVSSAEQDAAKAQRITNYNRAVRLAEIATIALSEISFRVDRQYTPTEDRSLTSSYKGQIKTTLFDEEDGFLFVRVEWIVEIRNGRKKFSRCAAAYDIFYKGLKGFDREIIDLYAENVARPTSYSYFRALYATIDWSAGLMSPPLPIIKLHPKV